MIVVNTDAVPGYEIVDIKGMVQGNTVRAKHLGRDIVAGFKNMVGGELKGYTELLTESRRDATTRMMQQAEQLGANAILNVRFSTSAITSGASEMLAYGTAAVVRPVGGVMDWRLSVCTLVHVSAATITGIGLARVWRRMATTRFRFEFSSVMPWLAAAMVLHGLYNLGAFVFEWVGKCNAFGCSLSHW